MSNVELTGAVEKEMSETFNSPIFGETRHGSDDERAQIAKAVAETPVTVFQELNKNLNERGLCLSIMNVVHNATSNRRAACGASG